MSDVRVGSLVAELDGDDRDDDRDGGIEGLDPVVMVHGLGGSSGTFEALMPPLAGRRVLRVDLPGAGRSPVRPGLRGIAGLAATVAEAMRAAGISRAHLIGHSLGTLVCRELARRDARAVAGLVLYGALDEPSANARQGLLARAAEARRGGMADIATAVSRASVSAPSHAANPIARAFVRESVLRQPPAGYAAHCEILAGVGAIDSSALAVPVTLVQGAEDPVATLAAATALAAHLRLADIELVRLPGVAHWPTIESPQACIDALAAHLSRTTPSIGDSP